MRKGDLTRERLVCEMMRLSHHRGFSATSVNDVLAAAGVKKGALYHHFPTKDDLGLAALECASAEFVQFLDAAIGRSTGLEALDSFFAAALSKHRCQEFIGGCPFGNAVLEMADGDPRYVAVLAAVFDEWVLRLERAIADGQRAGQVRDDIAPADLARLVVATVEGGIMLSRLGKEEGPMRGCVESLRTLLTKQA